MNSTEATTPSTSISLPSIDKPKEPTLVADERFSFVSKEELSVLSKGVKIVNITKATSWAVKKFNDWKRATNERAKEVLVPDDFVLCSDKEIITSILSRFVVETRKTNGIAYPPKTLYQLMCGLLRHMKECNSDCPNFLDKKDNLFRTLHSAMDAHFHHLHSYGVGREIKHAKSLSREDEQKLWATGVMGTTTPRALQNAAFFIVGKMFSLRGGQELRELKLSQVVRHDNPDRYEYTEHVSKTRNGTSKKLHVQSKVFSLYRCPEAGNRCPIFALDLYISKLPPEATTQDIFFFRPLEKAPTESTLSWYLGSQPVGRNTLDFKLRNMCSLAGIQAETISNHSLRATSATQMFEMGVPEKIIMERTGHKTLDALRTYERKNDKQHKTVSHILSNNARNTSTPLTFNNPFFSSNQSSNTLNYPQQSGFSFANLHGCTININAATVPPSTNYHLSERSLKSSLLNKLLNKKHERLANKILNDVHHHVPINILTLFCIRY